MRLCVKGVALNLMVEKRITKMSVRRPLIAGNWKMNGLRADGVALAEAVAAKATAAQIDLVELAGQRVALTKIAAQEYAGACPRCAGYDRFHVTATWFFCRQCHVDRGDALAYLAWVNDTDFVTTCQQLVGGALPVATAAPTTPAPKERKEQGADWAQGALRKLAESVFEKVPIDMTRLS